MEEVHYSPHNQKVLFLVKMSLILDNSSIITAQTNSPMDTLEMNGPVSMPVPSSDSIIGDVNSNRPVSAFALSSNLQQTFKKEKK